jgi:serine/threonine protein kinase
MGDVYRARDSRVKRDVAVKMSNTAFSDRFQREAEAIAALSHPNVCTLFDVGPNYLVMELMEGPTLAELLAKGRLPVPEALRLPLARCVERPVAYADRDIHRPKGEASSVGSIRSS